MSANLTDAKMPLGLRIKYFFLKRMGRKWIPEDHVQVIYENTRYAGVRVPNAEGLIRYSGWKETLGPLVYTGSIVHTYDLTDIVTRDNLPARIQLYTLLRYAPGQHPNVDKVLVNLQREIYPLIAETYFRCALRVAVNPYTGTQLHQADVQAEVCKLTQKLANEEMGVLGFASATPPRILKIELPEKLKERFEQNAQRHEGILAATNYHPVEYRRALATELLENLGRMGVGDAYVSLKEMFEETYASAQIPGGNVVDSQTIPPHNNDETKKHKRPKSRLV